MGGLLATSKSCSSPRSRRSLPPPSACRIVRPQFAELERVKPTQVLNCAGFTGRPNFDWCGDNKEDLKDLQHSEPIYSRLAPNSPLLMNAASLGSTSYMDQKWRTKESIRAVVTISKRARISQLAVTASTSSLHAIKRAKPFMRSLDRSHNQNAQYN